MASPALSTKNLSDFDRSIELRPAEPADADRGLLDVLEQLSPSGTGGVTADRARTVIAEMVAGETQFPWTALHAGRVVGTAMLIVERKLIHGGSRAGRIEDVVVDRRYRRRGIGRMLIERLCLIAAEIGCYKVVLCCDLHNVGFYEQCGFREHDAGMRIDVGPP
ncbi:MAG: GNAT family N-acetyltransferase [Planctomycetaceae bacterium]